MLKFKELATGASAISSAAERSLKISSVVLYVDGTSNDVTFTDFSGATFLDSAQQNTSGNIDYFVIKLNDYSDVSAYTATKIILKDSQGTEIAESETVSIVKTAEQRLNLRISGYLVDSNGASTGNTNKIGFNSTISGVPYATQLREGLVRFARGIGAGDDDKAKTVYSASQTESYISSVLGGDVSLSGYARWDSAGGGSYTDGNLTLQQIVVQPSYGTTTNQATITATTSGVSIDKALFVAGSPTPGVSNGAITDTTLVVNGNYIAALYSNSIDTTDASYGYKLVTSHAVKDYLDGTNNNYVHKDTTETISGAKTFSSSITTSGSALITGSAVYSSYVSGDGSTGWSNSGNNSKLPTVSATRDAITASASAITTAYQNADSNLQTQIDGINAGQNLADIVADRTALGNLAITDLKAKNDYKHGSSGDTWVSGDKVQVLEDNVAVSGSTVSTVYELVKGTKGSSPDLDAKTTGYYWDYIGPYGADSYSKSESDTKYVLAENLVGSSGIVDGASTKVPTADGVYDFVTGFGYAPLNGTNTFTGTSNTFSNAVSAGSISCNAISGKFMVSSTAYSFNTAGSLAYETSITSSADNTKLPTSLAVKNYIDGTGNDVVHKSGTEEITGTKTFSATTTTFAGVSATSVSSASYTGTGVESSALAADSKLPTSSVVKTYVDTSVSNAQSAVSTADTVGSIGLFIYTNPGNQLSYGSTVNGSHLYPVGMSLPYTGEIEYKIAGSQQSGSWKLLSAAFKRTAQSPCLVLAVKVSATAPSA